MLIVFKSPACADVMMFAENARDILGVIGKHGDDATGIITVEQLPAAIAVLNAAIDVDKKKPAEPPDTDAPVTADEVDVRFFQRAVPLLEMLERSLKSKVPVTWGV